MLEPQSSVLTNFTTTAICFIILKYLALNVKLYNDYMIYIDNKEFKLIVERKKIKNIYLRIKGNTLLITCPKYVSDKEISVFINEKKDWIIRTIKNNKKISKTTINEFIYYKGNKYSLKVLIGKDDVKIKSDEIIIRCKSGLLKDAVSVYYKFAEKEILDFVRSNQDKYLKVLQDYGYHTKPIYKIKMLKSMWGVCYNKKNLVNLSARLIHYEDVAKEAVLWHELLHFVLPNHSKRFHSVLELYMPSYKDAINRLD